jgi:hypothetical protein
MCLPAVAVRSPAAEPVPPAQEFRETPNSFPILGHQWSDYPTPQAPYNLEFLRTTDRETASMSLKEAVFVGLKNNPGIEVDRLEPFRAAEQTKIEKSIFDPTLNFQFNKRYTITPAGTSTSTFFQPIQTLDNRDYDFRCKNYCGRAPRSSFPF